MEEPVGQFATCSKEGIPNISNIGVKYLMEDDTIVVVDNYMKKTLQNILENPSVALLIRRDRESYQIKGRWHYLNSRPLYNAAAEWMEKKMAGFPAKGAVIIKPEKIYDSSSGDRAGKQMI